MGYIDEVLRLYVRLSDTPDRARSRDRELAAQLQRQQIPLELIRAALLLGAARRATRHPLSPLLPSIRSLHYFMPLLEEIRSNPPDSSYISYLESRSLKPSC